MSCPNLARIATHGDIYMNAHFEDYCEMARGDVQAGEKVNDYVVLYVFWRTTGILWLYVATVTHLHTHAHTTHTRTHIVFYLCVTSFLCGGYP